MVSPSSITKPDTDPGVARTCNPLAIVLVLACLLASTGCRALNANSKDGATRYADQHFHDFAESHQEEARVAQVRKTIPKGPDSLFAEYR